MESSIERWNFSLPHILEKDEQFSEVNPLGKNPIFMQLLSTSVASWFQIHLLWVWGRIFNQPIQPFTFIATNKNKPILTCYLILCKRISLLQIYFLIASIGFLHQGSMINVTWLKCCSLSVKIFLKPNFTIKTYSLALYFSCTI